MRAGSNPPEYYLTLSPASRQYTADGGRPLAMPFWGADKSVPEYVHAPAEAHDPFRADVYALGNLFYREFYQVCSLVCPAYHHFLALFLPRPPPLID